jgi:hypothetical protein
MKGKFSWGKRQRRLWEGEPVEVLEFARLTYCLVVYLFC